MTAAANQQRFETIQGVVERLTYHSEESGYIARLKASGNKELITMSEVSLISRQDRLVGVSAIIGSTDSSSGYSIPRNQTGYSNRH